MTIAAPARMNTPFLFSIAHTCRIYSRSVSFATEPGIFLVTPGDAALLPLVLSAAASYERPPSAEAMEHLVEQQELTPLFDQA